MRTIIGLVLGFGLFGLPISAYAVANVSFEKSNPKCKEKCSKRLTIGNYRHTYSSRSKLETRATYNDVTWVIVSDYVRESKKKKSKKYFYIQSSNSRKRTRMNSDCEGTERDISRQGDFVCLKASQVLIDGSHFGRSSNNFDLPALSRIGNISHTPHGAMTVAIISDDKHDLWVSDFNRIQVNRPWLTAATGLHARSDFSQILDAQVAPNGGYIASVYEWVNAYNKGLVLYYFDENGLVSRGNEHASEDKNIGFEPSIEIKGNTVVVTSRNSSDRTWETFEYTDKQLRTMQYKQHQFATGSVVDFMAGGGLQYANWSVNQKVEVKDVEKATTNYEMNTNILHSYFVQGRWGKSQLAVTMLRNEAEEQLEELTDNKLIQSAVNKYIIQYDYHGLFDGSSALRLGYSTMDAGGIASFEEGQTTHSHVFSSKRETFEALVIAEKGLFLGLYYHQFNSPSVIGFGSHDGRYLGSAFDEDFELSSVGLKLGYDEAAYGYRYETDYSRIYLNVTGFLGLAQLGVNRDALEEVTNERDGVIHGQYPLEVGLSGELGYIWQTRFRALKGFGASFQAGYKVDYYKVASNWDDEDDFPDDGFFINYDRDDIIHGPYARLNIIF